MAQSARLGRACATFESLAFELHSLSEGPINRGFEASNRRERCCLPTIARPCLAPQSIEEARCRFLHCAVTRPGMRSPLRNLTGKCHRTFQEIAFDFVADNPGLTLFHCHQQLHMDFGFMALFDYA